MDRPIYSFAGIELDTAKRQVRGADRTIEPAPLVFEALETLVRHSDRVVSKDELSDQLWPDRVVTEASISQVIRKARVALEECGGEPGLIRTQHGHGYRLDADVSVSDSELPDPEWQKHPFRTGAIVALLGGILVTLANVSDLLQWVVPDDSVEILEETQSSVESTEAKVEEVVRLLREQAARSGDGLDPEAESTIRTAVAAIVDSVDARKQSALRQLAEGDVEAAAEAVAAVAGDLDTASAQSVDAAAASWREAGAIYYTSNIDKSIQAYESAHRLKPGDAAVASDLAYTYLRAGRLDDAIALFETTAGSATTDAARADALSGAGISLKLNGDFAAAAERLGRALEAAEAAGDRRRRSRVLLHQGTIARARGDNDLALDLFRSAVEYAEEVGDRHLLAQSLNNLGIVLALKEQFGDAEEALATARSIHESRHDSAGLAAVIGNQGAIAFLQENVDTAEGYLLESVAIGERLGWQRSIALDLINLGSIAATREDFDLAGERLGRALDISRSAGLNEIHALTLVNLGELARDRGDPAEACRLWSEAMPRLEAMEHAAAGVVAGFKDAADCP